MDGPPGSYTLLLVQTAHGHLLSVLMFVIVGVNEMREVFNQVFNKSRVGRIPQASWTVEVQGCNASHGDWCCRKLGDPNSCCNSTFQAAIGTVMLPTASSAIQTPTVTPSANHFDCPSDKSTIVGASVGAPLGLALLIAVAALLYRGKRKAKDSAANPMSYSQYGPVGPDSRSSKQLDPVDAQCGWRTGIAQEVGGNGRHELPSVRQ